MSATDTQTLVNEAKCYSCIGTMTNYETLDVALWRRVLLAIDPMAATDSQTLFNEAKCYSCLGEVDAAQTLRLALLRRAYLALVPGADTSAQTLLTYAKCYLCLPSVSQADAVELALIDLVYQNEGSGPSTCENLEGAFANPNGNVTPDFIGQDYVNGGNVWRATDLTNSGWVEICEGCVAGEVSFSDGNISVFRLTDADSTSRIFFPNLTGAAPELTVNNSNALLEFSAPILIQAGTIGFNTDASLTTLVFTSLEVADSFVVSTCEALTSVGFGTLTVVNDTLSINDSPLLTTLSLPALTAIGVGFAVVSTGITSLSLSALTTPLPASTTVTGNASLVSFAMNGQSLQDGGSYDFSGNALNQASVDLVLHAGITGAMTSGLIDLTGGTNAAPSVAGQADKAALILAGVTVNTN